MAYNLSHQRQRVEKYKIWKEKFDDLLKKKIGYISDDLVWITDLRNRFDDNIPFTKAVDFYISHGKSMRFITPDGNVYTGYEKRESQKVKTAKKMTKVIEQVNRVNEDSGSYMDPGRDSFGFVSYNKTDADSYKREADQFIKDLKVAIATIKLTQGSGVDDEGSYWHVDINYPHLNNNVDLFKLVESYLTYLASRYHAKRSGSPY